MSDHEEEKPEKEDSLEEEGSSSEEDGTDSEFDESDSEFDDPEGFVDDITDEGKIMVFAVWRTKDEVVTCSKVLVPV